MGVGGIIKLPQIAGKLNGLSSALKGLTSSTWFKGLAGGLATFFSFEWLTSGGLVDSVSGTFGITETTGTIIMLVVVCLAIYLGFRYFDSRIPARPTGGNRSNNGNRSGGGNRSNGGGNGRRRHKKNGGA